MSTSPRSWPFNNKQNIFGNKIVYSPSPLSLHILDDSVIHTLIASLGYIIVRIPSHRYEQSVSPNRRLHAGASKKLTKVSVSEGKTSWPKTSADQQNYGIRFDYASQTTSLEGHKGEIFNKFQVQPNAGKFPSTFKDWRDRNGGTHAVMGTVYVKADGSTKDADAAFQKFQDEFGGKA